MDFEDVKYACQLCPHPLSAGWFLACCVALIARTCISLPEGLPSSKDALGSHARVAAVLGLSTQRDVPNQ